MFFLYFAVCLSSRHIWRNIISSQLCLCILLATCSCCWRKKYCSKSRESKQRKINCSMVDGTRPGSYLPRRAVSKNGKELKRPFLLVFHHHAKKTCKSHDFGGFPLGKVPVQWISAWGKRPNVGSSDTPLVSALRLASLFRTSTWPERGEVQTVARSSVEVTTWKMNLPPS